MVPPPASVFGQFALNSSAFGNVLGNHWIAGPGSGHPCLPAVASNGYTNVENYLDELAGDAVR